MLLKAMNLCELQGKLCDMKTLRLTNDLWCKTFRGVYVRRMKITELKNTYCVNYALF